MKGLFFACLILPGVFLRANEGDYAASRIPPELLKNANVVKRVEEEMFELRNPGEAYDTYHFVLTILNENGDKYAGVSPFYNKIVDIRSIEGVLYDANGKELKKLKNKDLQDVSGTGEESLVDDNRYKQFEFYYKTYPYTVEYTIEVKYTGTMFYPYWQPCDHENMAVQDSRFIFSCPAGYNFRYKSRNCSEPLIQKTSDHQIYTWEAKILPAITEEVFSPDLKKLTPYIAFGPTDFELLGYKGNMGTWQDFGKFIALLREGRDELPDNVRQKVHQLTDGVSDTKEKIRRLYEYMQSNTRYISIQLGIGSWQPFDAKYVSEKGFGDCKALSNYMYALLKEAGIKAYYTLIMAGDDAEALMTDFPSPHFNHVILFATVNKDTVWLECTSQTLPAGYLGSFTCNRYALAIDEFGGSLVHTPKYGMDDNVQTRKANAVLADDGTLTSKIFTHYTGLQQDYVHSLINSLSKDKVKDILNEELDFATYDVNQFNYQQIRGWKPAIDETLDVSVYNYATITGKRLFIVPNVVNRSGRKLKTDEERKYDIELTTEYRDIDSAVIEIPKGYEPESVPQPVSIDTKFGKYHSSVKLEDNRIYYYRNREQYSGTFPAADYNNLVKYYDDIYKADRNKIVFVKKDAN